VLSRIDTVPPIDPRKPLGAIKREVAAGAEDADADADDEREEEPELLTCETAPKLEPPPCKADPIADIQHSPFGLQPHGPRVCRCLPLMFLFKLGQLQKIE
jgi:hypothetical protein